tara:strand:- start:405 stop:1097 length:693 start_codon:yes stop_codon:yes gene_type:complete
MWPLSKKPKVDTKTKEYPEWRALALDFESDDLDSYLSGHSRLVIDEVRSIIPEPSFSHLFIAGGFAANVAGITTIHDDVDVFCTQDNMFKYAKSCFLKHGCAIVEEQNTHYSNSVKLDLNGLKYHLVDAVNMSSSHNIEELVCRFDFNWCMAGINLRQGSIHIHTDALSTTPKVNRDITYDNPDNMIRRLEKYRDRLKRTPDLEVCDRIIQIAKNRARNQEKPLSWLDGY